MSLGPIPTGSQPIDPSLTVQAISNVCFDVPRTLHQGLFWPRCCAQKVIPQKFPAKYGRTKTRQLCEAAKKKSVSKGDTPQKKTLTSKFKDTHRSQCPSTLPRSKYSNPTIFSMEIPESRGALFPYIQSVEQPVATMVNPHWMLHSN